MMPKQGRACLNFERTNFDLIACQMENFAERDGSILAVVFCRMIENFL